MTTHSLVPMAAAACGLDYGQLCLAIAGQARLKLADSNEPSAGASGSGGVA
jgi:hypothetical protein